MLFDLNNKLERACFFAIIATFVLVLAYNLGSNREPSMPDSVKISGNTQYVIQAQNSMFDLIESISVEYE